MKNVFYCFAQCREEYVRETLVHEYGVKGPRTGRPLIGFKHFKIPYHGTQQM